MKKIWEVGVQKCAIWHGMAPTKNYFLLKQIIVGHKDDKDKTASIVGDRWKSVVDLEQNLFD